MPEFSTDYLRAVADQIRTTPAAPPPPPTSNGNTWIGGGIAAGLRGIPQSIGGLSEVVGKAIGSTGLENWGAQTAADWQHRADQAGRPDLEINPWSEGGPSVIPWAIYQASKQLPMLALGGAAGKGLQAAGMVPSALSALAATSVPKFLGGGAGLAGEAATAAGNAFARNAVGFGLTSLPGAAESLYGQAKAGAAARGETPTQGAALAALAASPVQAAIGTVTPNVLGGILRESTGAGVSAVARNALVGSLHGAAAQVPAAGLQAAMGTMFRPDLSLSAKAGMVVDAALQGGAVGGVLGAGSGALGTLRRAPANTVTDETLKTATDSVIRPEQPALPGVADREQMPPGAGQARADVFATRPLADAGGEATPSPFAGRTDAQLAQMSKLLTDKATLGVATPEELAILPHLQTEQSARAAVLPLVGGEDLRGVDLTTNPRAPREAVPTEAAPVVVPPDQGSLLGIADREQLPPGDGQARADVFAARPLEEPARPEARVFEGLTQRQLTQKLKLLAQKATIGDATPDELGQFRALQSEQQLRAAESQRGLPLKGGGDFVRDETVNPSQALPQAELPPEALASSPGADAAVTAQPVATPPFVATDLTQGMKPRSQRERTLFDAIHKAETPEQAAETLRQAVEDGYTKTPRQAENASAIEQKLEALRTGGEDAVQVGRAEGLDVREPAPAGEGVAEGDAQGREPAVPSVGEAIPGTAEETRQVAEAPQGPAQADTPLSTTPQGEGAITWAADKPGVWRGESDPYAFRASSEAAPSAPLSAPAFARAYDKTMKLIGKDRESAIHIVGTPEELPAHVRAAAEAQGIPASSVRGVQADGETYIVRSNVKSEADLSETLLHEVLGHGGARALMGRGQERVDTMERLFDAAGGVDGIQKIAKRFGVLDALKEYIPDRELNSADKAQVFDELLAQAAGKNTGKIGLALQAWAGELKRSLITFLENRGLTALAKRLDTVSALDTALLLKNMREAVNQGRSLRGDDISFQRAAPAEANDLVRKGVETVGDTWEKIKAAVTSPRLKSAIHATETYTNDLHSLAQLNDHLFQNAPVAAYGDLKRHQSVVRQRFSSLATGMYDAVNALAASKNKAVEPLMDLMRASGVRINPSLKPEEHTWLRVNAEGIHDPNGKLPAAAEIRIREANTWLNNLRRMGQEGVYRDLIAHNEMQNFAHQAAVLREWVLHDPVAKNLEAFQADPATPFRENPTNHETVAGARAYYEGVLKTYMDALTPFVSGAHNEAMGAAGPARTEGINRITPLERVLRNTQKSLENSKEVPYFHLGRTGDWFTAFDLAGPAGADGKITQADPRAVQAVTDILAKRGFDNIEMSYANDKPGAYIRTGDASQAQALVDALKEAQAAGYVQAGSIDYGTRAKQNINQRVSTELLKNYKDHIENSGDFEPEKGATQAQRDALAAAKSDAIERMQNFLLDLSPDSSINKVMVHREGVRGYNKDMMQNFAHRAMIGANEAASHSAAPGIRQVLQGMHSDIREAGSQQGSPRPVAEVDQMSGIYNELLRRQVSPPPTMVGHVADIAKAANYTAFTGFSPASAMVQLASLGQFTLPELGKRFGHVKSAMMLGKVTPEAFRVMREAFSAGNKTSLLNAADGAITSKTLADAKLSASDQKILRDAIADGTITTGNQTRDLGHMADGKVGGVGTNTLRYATAMTQYAEVFARVVTALAAGRLHGDTPGQRDYVSKTIRETQFTFDDYNNPRMLSKNGGIAGPLTPIMASFLSWQTQAMAKMYREMGVALGGMTGNKVEARRFLVGHLGAMTVLAGTLGLPFASVAARVADKVADEFSEDGKAPYDVKSAWRGFLADTFGKDVGEMLAHGASRGIGVDVSGRIGEQDLLPFSRFLTDRRKARDVIEDLALRAEGSPVSMAVNIFDGLNDVFNRGDVLQGMVKILPVALRNPLNAYRMTTMGYVDAQNNRLPMEPGARAILSQAIGFTPSEKAEYTAAQMAQNVRHTDLDMTRQLIGKHYATAVEQGDPASAAAAIRQATIFGQQNPAYMPNLGQVMQSRAQARMMAQGMGVPMHVNPRDVGARELNRGYNFAP